MDVVTPVIGIPAWDWKKSLLNHAQKKPRWHGMIITDYCHECSRHFELLKLFDKKTKGEWKNSQYYKYQKEQGKKKKGILQKIQAFEKLYKSVASKGCKEPPVVTDDGCRLNGSHRLAILIHLSETYATVNIAVYEDIFDDKKAKEIRRNVKRYREEVYGL